MKTLHNNYCNSKQGYLPLFLSDCLDLLDPVLTFDRLMGGIDLNKYLTDIPEYTTGRLRYNPVNMLKTVLFGFMTSGYCSLRELEDNHYRSDMDCFVPLMEHFKQTYGFYPKYPVADAGYGSYNNYIFCEQNGIEKYMKFPMFKKETKDQKYHEDPFRTVNFRIDEQGVMRCPNDKAFHFLYRKNVRGNQYGRKEELYECEDCSGCPYAEKCKKTDKNRTVRINQELTSMHQEVIENLESIHGALLRMNRSIQAEGTFGIMKNDRWYKRIVRRGIHSVKLEVLLVAIGHNLYKYQKKKMRNRTAA